MTRVDWSGHWVDPTDLSFGLLTLHSICIELMIRSGTIGKFSAGQPYSKLPNFHFEGREGRSQAGPKGRKLEVGAQRAPKLLVIYIIVAVTMNMAELGTSWQSAV